MADGKYHIGFALSGGFIRGIAHLGMLQALFEHNIRPDILSGTSAGAIVSVFIADGKQPFEIMEMFSVRLQSLPRYVSVKTVCFRWTTLSIL